VLDDEFGERLAGQSLPNADVLRVLPTLGELIIETGSAETTLNY
jgi:hypothetical protein